MTNIRNQIFGLMQVHLTAKMTPPTSEYPDGSLVLVGIAKCADDKLLASARQIESYLNGE